MSDAKKFKRNIDGKGRMRFVTKNKWELPMRHSKSYWDKIYEGVESKVIRVRKPFPSSSTLHPVLSSSIQTSESSASGDDIMVYDLTEHHTVTDIVDASDAEPIGQVCSPLSSHENLSDSDVKLSPSIIKIDPDLEEKPNDESSKNLWKLTKLSKMTKLVNEFLSNTRTRVRPSSAASNNAGPFSEKSREAGPTHKAELSSDDQSKDSLSRNESVITAITIEDPMENLENISERPQRKTVAFRDDSEEIVKEGQVHDKDFAGEKLRRRQRAPSLSVASALPSFGKVVISIEDINSMEDKEEPMKIEDDVGHSSNLISKDNSEMTDHRRAEVEGRKVSQDFLKVPEVRVTGIASYPGHDRSKISSTQSEDASESKLLMESQELRNKQSFWSRRSIVNALQSLKAMKNGLGSKAKMDSETNRFFAMPLEIYSPSVTSSISSDDQTESIDVHAESETEHIDEMVNEKGSQNRSEDKVDGESELYSYVSVHERLMPNAEAHLRKAFRTGAATFTDEDTVLEATSNREDPALSCFYGSNISTRNELKAKRSNKKTPAPPFIRIPKVARIFPRIKADKCLACMHKPPKVIVKTRGRKVAGQFLSTQHGVLFFEQTSELFGFEISSGASLEEIYRHHQLRASENKSDGKSLGKDHTSWPSRSTIARKNQEPTTIDVTPASVTDLGSLTKGPSQVDDSHRSSASGMLPSKSLVRSKSIISPLSLASERSRSISDHDDSDQGYNDPGGTGNGPMIGASSKFLAPCHMPIVLQPSLEPLNALRHKKPRSIRSRVASAEKSIETPKDDDDSDDDNESGKMPVGPTKSKSEHKQPPSKFDIMAALGTDSTQSIDVEKSLDQVADEQLKIYDMETKADFEGSDLISDLDDDECSSQNLPIITEREVLKISSKCLAENRTVTDILKILAKEYAKRIEDKCCQEKRSSSLTNARKSEIIAKNLLALLVDSKSYLNHGKWINETSDLSFSSKQPDLCNSRQLRRILPLKSYNLVAPILGMAKWYPTRKISSTVQETEKRSSTVSENPVNLTVDTSSKSGYNVAFEETWEDKPLKGNPYSLFLTKPRRKAVTWRPLTTRDLEGYDPEATLKMRATRFTDSICEDFCKWLESLAAGTNQTSNIDVDVLKDMFEIDFTSDMCKTLQVSIKEMPMVPTAVAAARNCPGAGELALTRRHLINDDRAEKKPKRSVGFGSALPHHLKFIPPRNHVDDKWLQCKAVPTDLETMDAIWKGIIHLDSVKGFINWLKVHPEVARPKILENVLASKETLATRHSQDVDDFGHLELNLDQIDNLKVGDNDPDAN